MQRTMTTKNKTPPRLVAARIAVTSALAVALLGGANQARAAEIRLLSAAAMQTVFKEIIGDFERTSGHKMVIRYSTMGAITERIMGGEVADLHEQFYGVAGALVRDTASRASQR